MDLLTGIGDSEKPIIVTEFTVANGHELFILGWYCSQNMLLFCCTGNRVCEEGQRPPFPRLQ
jgi:hypothetical protein